MADTAISTAGTPTARVTAAVALVGLSGAWNAGNVGPVASELSSEFGISLSVVGVLSGTLFLGSTVVGLLWAAQLGERTGLVRGLRLGCLLLVAGNLLFALSPAFAGLAVARVLPGLAFAAINTFGVVYARQAGGVKLVGIFGASIQLGIAGALAVGSGLADLDVDWRVGFAISALLGLAALLALPRAETEASAPQPHRPGFLRAALRHAHVWRLALLFVSVYGIPIVLAAWLVEYLTGSGDVATALAGGLSFVLFGLAAAMRVAGAQLQQRGVPHAVLAGSLALAAGGLVLLAADPVTAVVAPAVIALGIGFAIPYSTMMTNAQQLFPAEPSEPMALLTLAGLLPPIAVIPIVGHALAQGDGDAALLALAAFVAIATAANLRDAGIPLRVDPPGPEATELGTADAA